MYANLERIKQKMDQQGLDGLVATTLGNVFYLTGVYSDGLKLYPYEHQSYAVITRDRPGEPIFIASAGLVNQAWISPSAAGNHDVAIVGLDEFRERLKIGKARAGRKK